MNGASTPISKKSLSLFAAHGSFVVVVVKQDSARTSHQIDGTAVGYLRRSTDRQEQSIPDQRLALERYATERGLSISRFYIDDAISGTTATRRRAFQEMVSDAQQDPRPFAYVLVYDVKRFGRVGNDEAGYYRHILKTHGVEVSYVSENFSGDGTDDLLRPVKQWQAREESKDLSKVTIRGLLSKVVGGSWMGGVPPFGYDLRYQTDRAPNGEFLFVLRFMPDGTKQLLDESGTVTRTLERGEAIHISKRDHARLVPSSPDRRAILERIFRLSAEENRGLRSIADLLNSEGTPPPRGPAWSHIYHGAWTASTVRSILVNPIYVGDMVWNRRTDARFHKISGGRATERRDVHGARLVPNPQADWIRIENAHPPLVSRRLFEMARDARETRPTSKRQRGIQVSGGWKGKRSRFLLSGLVHCSRCGGRYEGTSRSKGKRRIDGSVVRTYYYGCGNYIRRGRSTCTFGAVGQEQLEVAVADAVLDHYEALLGDHTEQRLEKIVREGLGTDSANITLASIRARDEIHRIETTIANLLDNITAVNRSLVDERLKVLTREKEEIARRMSELEKLALGSFQVEAVVHEAWAFVSSLRTTLKHGPPEQRIRAIRSCLTSVVFDSDAHTAVLRLQRVPGAGLRGILEERTVTVPSRSMRKPPRAIGQGA